MSILDLFKRKKVNVQPQEPYWKVEQARINKILRAIESLDDDSNGKSVIKEPQKSSYYNLN